MVVTTASAATRINEIKLVDMWAKEYKVLGFC